MKNTEYWLKYLYDFAAMDGIKEGKYVRVGQIKETEINRYLNMIRIVNTEGKHFYIKCRHDIVVENNFGLIKDYLSEGKNILPAFDADYPLTRENLD